MLDQTFALSDLPKIFFLAFLEILLSADNAIVLGVLVSRLPSSLRQKALYIGAVSAFLIRALSLLSIGFLLQYRWMQILGAAYLLYLSFHHFLKKKHPKKEISHTYSFWKTVLLIELFDIAFAFDSIFAGVAFISTEEGSHFQSKLWIVYFGGMIGLLSIRYAAHFFSGLVEKFPRLENSAYLMIGWIAIKLGIEITPFSSQFEPIFWIVLVSLFLTGFVKGKK